MKNKFKEYNSKINWFTFFLLSIFTWSSWLCATSIWSDLPIIVFETEEQWRLPSVLTVIAQLAQLGPILIYPSLKYIFPSFITNKRVIYTKLLVESIVLIFLFFFWKKKIFFLNENKSIVLYISNFIFSFFDGISTVSFLPYINEFFNKEYIIPNYIGESMSSLLPSLIVFLQGIRSSNNKCSNVTYTNNSFFLEPTKPISNFSVSIYFFMITIFLILSFISFFILNSKLINKKNTKFKNIDQLIDENIKFLGVEHQNMNLKQKRKKIDSEIIILLVLVYFISFFMYGILPGLQSYSTLSYSHLAFNLSINLGNLLLPIAVFLSIWSYKPCLKQIVIEFLVGILFTIYIIITSIYSPCPPFLKNWFGIPLIVMAWTLTECIFIRLRCVIAAKLENYGEKVLIILGIVTLIGQMMGGVLIYILVDIYRTFKQRPECVSDYSYCKF